MNTAEAINMAIMDNESKRQPKIDPLRQPNIDPLMI